MNKLTIQPIQPHHLVNDFCSNTTCDLFLKNDEEYLTKNEKRGAKTYVIVDKSNKVIAFYALSMSKQKPHGIFLEELAVDYRHHKKGIGRLLLLDVFQKCFTVSELTGCAGIHLISEPTAVDFYKKFGFQPYNPYCELHLFIHTNKLTQQLEL